MDAHLARILSFLSKLASDGNKESTHLKNMLVEISGISTEFHFKAAEVRRVALFNNCHFEDEKVLTKLLMVLKFNKVHFKKCSFGCLVKLKDFHFKELVITDAITEVRIVGDGLAERDKTSLSIGPFTTKVPHISIANMTLSEIRLNSVRAEEIKIYESTFSKLKVYGRPHNVAYKVDSLKILADKAIPPRKDDKVPLVFLKGVFFEQFQVDKQNLEVHIAKAMDGLGPSIIGSLEFLNSHHIKLNNEKGGMDEPEKILVDNVGCFDVESSSLHTKNLSLNSLHLKRNNANKPLVLNCGELRVGSVTTTRDLKVRSIKVFIHKSELSALDFLNQTERVMIEDSSINSILLVGKCDSFRLGSTGVGEFFCDRGFEFTGATVFDQVSFSTAPDLFHSKVFSNTYFNNCKFYDFSTESINRYRDIKSKLLNLHNERGASLFRSLELEAVFKNQHIQFGSIIEKLLGFFSFTLNRFGRHFTQPLIVLFIIYLGFSFLYYFGELEASPHLVKQCGGVSSAFSNNWRCEILNSDTVWKSLYFSFENSLGPLRLLAPIKIFTAPRLLFFVVSWIQVFTSTVIWYLLIVGTKRRYS